MPRASFLVTGLLTAMVAASPALAQSTPSAAEIIERLRESSAGGAAAAPTGPTEQKRRTRGLSVPPSSAGAPPSGSGTTPASVAAPAPAGLPPPADKPAVDKLFSKAPRGLSTGERREAAVIAQSRPTLDLTIFFDFNSADIGPNAVPALVELGQALASDALAGRRFLVAGHTDAKGGNDYNQRLSERRAAAIKRFLAVQFGIDEGRLLAIGFGEEQLKNKADPNADENRRVQVVNLGG